MFLLGIPMVTSGNILSALILLGYFPELVRHVVQTYSRARSGQAVGPNKTQWSAFAPFHPIPPHAPKEHSFVYSFLVMFRCGYMYIHKDTHTPQAGPYTPLKITGRRTPHTVLHLAFITQQYSKHVLHQCT